MAHFTPKSARFATASYATPPTRDSPKSSPAQNQSLIDLLSDSTLEDIAIFPAEELESAVTTSGVRKVILEESMYSSLVSNYEKLQRQIRHYELRVEALREKEIDLATQTLIGRADDVEEFDVWEHQNQVMGNYVVLLNHYKEALLQNKEFEEKIEILEAQNERKDEQITGLLANKEGTENIPQPRSIENNSDRMIRDLQEQLQKTWALYQESEARWKESERLRLESDSSVSEGSMNAQHMLAQLGEAETKVEILRRTCESHESKLKVTERELNESRREISNLKLQLQQTNAALKTAEENLGLEKAKLSQLESKWNEKKEELAKSHKAISSLQKEANEVKLQNARLEEYIRTLESNRATQHDDSEEIVNSFLRNSQQPRSVSSPLRTHARESHLHSQLTRPNTISERNRPYAADSRLQSSTPAFSTPQLLSFTNAGGNISVDSTNGGFPYTNDEMDAFDQENEPHLSKPSPLPVARSRSIPTSSILPLEHEARVKALESERQKMLLEMESMKLRCTELESHAKVSKQQMEHLKQTLDQTEESLKREKHRNESLNSDNRLLSNRNEMLIQQKSRYDLYIMSLLDKFEAEPEPELESAHGHGHAQPISFGETSDYIVQRLRMLQKGFSDVKKAECECRVEISLLREQIQKGQFDYGPETSFQHNQQSRRNFQVPVPGSHTGNHNAEWTGRGLPEPLSQGRPYLQEPQERYGAFPEFSSSHLPGVESGPARGNIPLPRQYASFQAGGKVDLSADANGAVASGDADQDMGSYGSVKLRRFISGVGSEDRITRLNAELNYLSSTLDQRNKEIKHAMQQLRQAKKELVESDIAKRDLEVKRSELRESVDDLHQRLSSLQQTYEETNFSLSTKAEQLKEAEAEISRLRENMISKSRELQTIQYKVQDAEAKCEVLEDIKNQYHDKVMAANLRMIQQDEKIQAEIERNERLEIVLKGAKDQKSEVDLENAKLKIHIDSLQSRIRDLGVEKSQLEEKVNSLIEEVDQYKNMSRVHGDSDYAPSSRGLPRDFQLLAKQALQDQQPEIDRLQTKDQLQQKEIKNLEAKLEGEKKLSQHLMQKCNEFEQEIKQLKGENMDLNSAISDLKAQIYQQQLTINSLSDLLQHARSDIQTLEDEKAAIQIAHDGLLTRCAQSEASHQKLQIEYTSLRRSFDSDQVELVKLRKELATLQDLNQALSATLDKEKDEKRSALQSLGEKDSLIARLEEEKSDLNNRFLSTQKILTDTRMKLADVASQLEQVRIDADASKVAMESTIKALKNEIRDAKNKAAANLEALRLLEENEAKMFNSLCSEYDHYLRMPTTKSAYESFTSNDSRDPRVLERESAKSTRDMDSMFNQLKSVWKKRMDGVSADLDSTLRLLLAVLHDVGNIFDFDEIGELILTSENSVSGKWKDVFASLDIVVPKSSQDVMRFVMDELRGLIQKKTTLLDDRIRMKNEVLAKTAEKESIQKSLSNALAEITHLSNVITQYTISSAHWVEERQTLYAEKEMLQERIAELLGDIESYRTMETRYAQFRETWAEEREYLIEERDRALSLLKSSATAKPTTLTETQLLDKIKLLESQCVVMQQELQEARKQNRGLRRVDSYLSQGSFGDRSESASRTSAHFESKGNATNSDADATNKKMMHLLTEKERWEGIVITIANMLGISPPTRIDMDSIDQYGRQIFLKLQARRCVCPTAFPGFYNPTFATTHSMVSPPSLYTSTRKQSLFRKATRKISRFGKSEKEEYASPAPAPNQPIPYVPPYESLPSYAVTGTMTRGELAMHDGSNRGLPTYVGIKGKVFDVENNPNYCAGGNYSVFAGKEANRGFAKMSTNAEDLTHDTTGLSKSELECLESWVAFFESKYKLVARIAE